MTMSQWKGVRGGSTASFARGEADYDHLFKILLLGESGAGKSALMLRYADDFFSDNYISTIGVDFKFTTLDTKKGVVKLQIWDTAGQERFKSITRSFYRGAHGVIIVFDVTNYNSFRKVQEWVSEVDHYGSRGCAMMLVGNKVDLKDHRVVSREEAEHAAAQLGCPYIETSAKTGNAVGQAFEEMTENLLEMSVPSLDPKVSHVEIDDGVSVSPGLKCPGCTIL